MSVHPGFDAGRLAAAAGGRLVATSPDTPLAGTISTDTRRLRPGDVFLALRGERHDGAAHIAEALDRGAAGVIAEADRLDGATERGVAVAVADPRAALFALARARRPGLRAPVIGVTGAAGKTTTVELLAGLLGPALRVHATAAGHNTHLGVAATLAAAPIDAGAVVVELAMFRGGEIAFQAELARPTAGLITTIGPVHLATTGSVAGVAAAKAELIAALPAGAPCVIPAGEPLLDPYRRDDLRTLTHGPGGDVSLVAFDGEVAEIDCAGERVDVRPGFGQPHNLANLVAAVAAVHALGHRPAAAVDIPLPALRWQRARVGAVDVVLDCFNSSPHALGAALGSFAAEPAGRRLAVLAPFADAGPDAAALERAAGAAAWGAGVGVLIAVGEGTGPLAAGFPGPVHRVADPAAARRLLEAIGRPGDRALVKGPRVAALERVVG